MSCVICIICNGINLFGFQVISVKMIKSIIFNLFPVNSTSGGPGKWRTMSLHMDLASQIWVEVGPNQPRKHITLFPRDIFSKSKSLLDICYIFNQLYLKGVIYMCVTSRLM